MLTAARAREVLYYNPDTGVLLWKRRLLRPGHEHHDKIWNSCWAGKAAGWDHLGHIATSVDCRKYLAHRLAWLIHYGEWPSRDIDHVDGNGKNNRIANLRLATDAQNLANAKIRTDNTSGHKGVYQDRRDGRFYVKIRANGRDHSLGGYDTLEAAAAAYAEGSKTYHGEFGRIR